MASFKTVALSPSGKYYLEIKYSATTECKFYHSHDKSLITTINFEYPFGYNFLQDKEKEYLITSRSSRGMTIIDCETGQKWSYEPEESDDWCHDWTLVPKSNILVLQGYVHCGSYVFWQFYDWDLTKFKEGLPELEEVLPCDQSVYLHDEGSFNVQQGKDISAEMLKGIKVEPDEYYLVFKRTIGYNTAVKMPQDELLFDPEHWFPLLPQEDQDKVKAFLKKWESRDLLENHTQYYEEKKELADEFASYLEKDLVVINSQEAILQRQGDKMVYLVVRNLDEETGVME